MTERLILLTPVLAGLLTCPASVNDSISTAAQAKPRTPSPFLIPLILTPTLLVVSLDLSLNDVLNLSCFSPSSHGKGPVAGRSTVCWWNRKKASRAGMKWGQASTMAIKSPQRVTLFFLCCPPSHLSQRLKGFLFFSFLSGNWLEMYFLNIC